MEQNPLYDINQVCNMLGTTSRTLRFYEEKGIIHSTVIGTSSRRQYTEEQIAHIRNVLALRTLGLSVNTIAKLQHEEADLKNAMLSKRAEIYAFIDTHIRKINLLSEALLALESGKNIFEENWQNMPCAKEKEKQIASLCANAVLNGDDRTLYQYLSPRLAQYMPIDVYCSKKADAFAVLGDFVSFEKTEIDKIYPNKIYHYIKFSKLGLKITFVFHNGMIDGLWLTYYDTNTRCLT